MAKCTWKARAAHTAAARKAGSPCGGGAGTWKGGVSVLGLKEGGVDWALDQYNEKLITPEMKAKVEAAKADIIAGKIVVHDYMSDNSCK